MSAAVRFTNETRDVTFGFFVKNDLSDAENDQILTFSVKVRAEFAESDILHDRKNHRI